MGKVICKSVGQASRLSIKLIQLNSKPKSRGVLYTPRVTYYTLLITASNCLLT